MATRTGKEGTCGGRRGQRGNRCRMRERDKSPASFFSPCVFCCCFHTPSIFFSLFFITVLFSCRLPVAANVAAAALLLSSSSSFFSVFFFPAAFCAFSGCLGNGPAFFSRIIHLSERLELAGCNLERARYMRPDRERACHCVCLKPSSLSLTHTSAASNFQLLSLFDRFFGQLSLLLCCEGRILPYSFSLALCAAALSFPSKPPPLSPLWRLLLAASLPLLLPLLLHIIFALSMCVWYFLLHFLLVVYLMLLLRSARL